MATTKEKMGCVIGIMTIFVWMPIGWITTYGILSHIGAPQWLWTLFFIGVPVGLIVSVLSKVAESFLTEK